MNRLYGLIGFPLGHSFSARYFTEKFQRENLSGYEYRNFPLESIRELPAMLENHPGLLGFNVTIPYKQEVIPFLTALSAEAREIGAVNCVKITARALRTQYGCLRFPEIFARINRPDAARCADPGNWRSL